MIKTYVQFFLFSALSFVDMKPLNEIQHVRQNVTINCLDWPSITNVKSNVKYFCDSPCKTEQHIIVKAAFGETANKGRIQLTNSADGLFVTFFNVQKSDSKQYYCGAEKLFWRDSFIEVNLKVIDAESSNPQTSPKTVNVGSTLFFAVTVSSILPTIITNMSAPLIVPSTNINPTSATQGAGSLPHLIIGVTVLIAVLIVLLKLMGWMTKKQLKVEETQEDCKYEEIRPEDEHIVDQQTTTCALYISADLDSLYANYSYHKDTELTPKSGNSKDFSFNSAFSSGVSSGGACTDSRDTDSHCLYVNSVAQLPKTQIEPTGQSEPNQTESHENDCIYSLAELPKPT